METTQTIRSILDALRRLVRELRISSRRAETRFGLSAAQLFVLERVAMSPRPVSINELAELTLTHQSSVSVVAQRLVKQKFLEQRAAPDDRRRKELTMTARGAQALKRVPSSVQDRLIAVLSKMPTHDRATLARLLHSLTDTLGLQDAEPVLFFENERRRRKPARSNPPTPTRRKRPA